ncbi:MAG: Fic family protein [Ahrensia sp.]|nr:Fic family protein [Ahrensia sp.]
MWEEIEAKKQELDSKRPLAAGSLRILDDWYDVELTYTSNAIEGNTLTRSETAIVLERGLTVRGKHLKDHLEAVDHKEALDFVRHLAIQDASLREVDIRDIHRLVLGRTDAKEAGRYSRFDRAISGSTVVFPPPADVAPLMKQFGEWLSNSPSTPETAFEAHARLVSIHPFTDGNGRTARLLMNLILIKGGYPPVIVSPEDRPDYIDALELRQTSGDNTAFENLMATQLIASLDRYIEAASKEIEGHGKSD